MPHKVESPLLQGLAAQLAAHPLYRRVSDAHSLRVFMRAHVFCVWDFQCLLKALQRELSCVAVPWLPTRDAEARRLINEVVLEEESDLHPDGGYASHFELYREAMDACGADARPIDAFLEALRQGQPVEQALERGDVPAGVAPFVHATFEIIDSGDLHRTVAAFTHAREDLIPVMFERLVSSLQLGAPCQWGKFRYYLERHIEVDGERHGPISHALLQRVCGTDERLWREAEAAAAQALRARIALWDAVVTEIRTEQPRAGAA